MRLFSINCTSSYFLNQKMGSILNLQEGHPVEVHMGLRSLIFRVIEDLRIHKDFSDCEIKPGVQFNSRDFYFREEEFLRDIFELYQNKHVNKEKVYGTIHQANDMQPIKACKSFIEELNNNINYHLMFGTNNLTVHLPVDKENRISEISEILSSDAISEVITSAIKRNPNLSIDFENNHHKSFFGNLDHCILLFETLKDKLQDLGRLEIFSHLNICFDSGHYFIDAEKMGYNKRGMLENFFEQMKEKINTLHIHTNDSIDDRHLLLTHPLEDFSIIPPLNKEKIKQNTTLILDSLPILNLQRKKGWNIVSETDKPYKYEDLLYNFRLIFEHIK